MVGHGRRFSTPLLPVGEETDAATLDPSLLVRAFRAGEQLGPPPQPTTREQDILQLLADDLDTEEVTQRLVISRYTVRSHIENLRLKYKKHSITGIVALALRKQWIT